VSPPVTRPDARRAESLLLASALVLLALILRLYRLDDVRHNIDHAYPIWQALRTLDYRELPVVGQATSVLFANPALTGYLYLPVVALFRHPLAVYALVAALNALASGFTYYTARALFGRTAPALIAALIVTVNPWLVEYSRTTWVQSLMPFFVTGAAWLIVPVLLGQAARPGRRLFTAALLVTAFTQTYLLALFLPGTIGLLLLIFYKRVPWRAAAAGIAAFALVSAIYGVALLTGSGGNLDRADDFVSAPAQISGEAFSHALRLVTGEGYTVTRGASLSGAGVVQTVELVLHIALLIPLAVGTVLAVRALLRRTPQRDAALILLIWWLLPVAAMTLRTNPIHPFYQMLGLPMGALLAAWPLGEAARRVRWRGLIAALLAVWCALSLTGLLRFADETAASPSVEGLGGLPVGTGVTLGGVLRTALPEGGFVYGEVSEYILNSLAGRPFAVIPGVQSDRLTAFPDVGALHVSLDGFTPPDAEAVRALPLADGRVIRISRVSAAQAPLDALAVRLDAPSEAGLTFIGYTLEALGSGDSRLTTAWRIDRVDDTARAAFYGPFVHVYDANGTRTAILDTVPVSGLLWNLGDVYIQRTLIPAPPAGFRLEVGQYDLNAQQATTFILPGGVFTQAVEIRADSPEKTLDMP
jgi:4-amino-4-deoxy-L-arabinose transferase-like glycosyltransferase